MATFGSSRTLKEMLEEYEWELPTSFIDVVFLLLLYFTLTMKFHTMEQRLEAWLPKDKGPNQVAQQITKLDELVINVTAAGPGKQLDTPVFSIRDFKVNSTNQLAQQLNRMRQAADMPVVINGRPNCPFKHIMSALDACAWADLRKVEFRAPPAQGAGGSDSDYDLL